MAAFVDGQLPNNDTSPSPSDSGPDHADHESSLRKIDIGPLIGVERGFRTREKAPMSGGMSGVEVVSAGSVFSDRRNTVDVGSVTAKDSHLAVSVGRSTLPELRVSPATASPSPRKERKGKLKPHRVCRLFPIMCLKLIGPLPANGLSHNETSAKSMSNGQRTSPNGSFCADSPTYIRPDSCSPSQASRHDRQAASSLAVAVEFRHCYRQ